MGGVWTLIHEAWCFFGMNWAVYLNTDAFYQWVYVKRRRSWLHMTSVVVVIGWHDTNAPLHLSNIWGVGVGRVL